MKSRQEINADSSLHKASRDNTLNYNIRNVPHAEAALRNVPVTPRANFKPEFPKPEYRSRSPISSICKASPTWIKLLSLLALLRSARVALERAGRWLGLWASPNISTANSRTAPFTLVDAKSGDPMDDKDVQAKYEANTLAHLDIRLVGRLTCTLSHCSLGSRLHRGGSYHGRY